MSARLSHSFVSPVKTGLRDALPVILGLVPFGLTIGSAVATSGMSIAAGWIGGPALVAGAAHLSIVTALSTGTAPFLAVATAIFINLRFAAYSAAMAPLFDNQPRWFRWTGPYLIFDQVFALATGRPEATVERDWFRSYWIALTGPIVLSWVLLISAGIGGGSMIPDHWQLWFVAPLMFSAILAPTFGETRSMRAAFTAAVVAVAGTGLPDGVGLVLAIALGVAAGSTGAASADE